MSYRRLSAKKALVIAAITLVIVGVGSIPLHAQAPGGVLGEILAKLDEIIAILQPAAPPDRVTLTTPAVFIQGGGTSSVTCLLLNVGTEPLETVTVTEFSASTGNSLGSASTTSLSSGRAAGTGGPVFDSAAIRCEFVFNGPAESARANLVVSGPDGPSLNADAR